jgi:hypothetical protein
MAKLSKKASFKSIMTVNSKYSSEILRRPSIILRPKERDSTIKFIPIDSIVFKKDRVITLNPHTKFIDPKTIDTTHIKPEQEDLLISDNSVSISASESE